MDHVGDEVVEIGTLEIGFKLVEVVKTHQRLAEEIGYSHGFKYELHSSVVDDDYEGTYVYSAGDVGGEDDEGYGMVLRLTDKSRFVGSIQVALWSRSDGQYLDVDARDTTWETAKKVADHLGFEVRERIPDWQRSYSCYEIEDLAGGVVGVPIDTFREGSGD
jgi:hypothetical protein